MAAGERQGIYLSGAHSYITFDGIGMNGANHASLDWPGCCGLQLDGTNGNINHITYKNAEFKNNKCGSWGSHGSNDITAQGNWFHGDQCNRFSHGIYANQPSTRWIIEGNIIEGFVNYGIQIYTCCSTNYTIRNNIFRNNGSASFGGSGIVVYGDNHIIYDNIIHGNKQSGIKIRSGFGVKAYNNTLYQNGEYGIVNESGSSVTCKNNRALSNSRGQINGCSDPSNQTSGTPTSIWVDPANGNFSLKSNVR